MVLRDNPLSQSEPASLAARLELNMARRSLPMLHAGDVQVQHVLGSGAFSQVFQVNMPCLNEYPGEDEHIFAFTACCKSNRQADREAALSLDHLSIHTAIMGISSCSCATQDLQLDYALKKLRPIVLASDVHRDVAIKDFVLEVELLSKLPVHPNIIKMTALSENFFQDPASAFFVMEKVQETLQTRFKTWKSSQRRRLSLGGMFDLSREYLRDQQAHRLSSCALGITKALQHLHRHNIIYRDLKPTNIGFMDSTDQVKLFDFGMARTCPEDRRMTGCAGTLRYMAPEVAHRECYDLSADIYSLGVVIWQVCVLQKPMSHITESEDWYKAVVDKQRRPSLRAVVDPEIRGLISRCWSADAQARPSMDQVLKKLQDVCCPNRRSLHRSKSSETGMMKGGKLRAGNNKGSLRLQCRV